MAPRYGIAIGVAAALTFGILFVMQLLVATEQNGLTENRHRPNWIDFVRVERDQTLERIRDKPEKPPEPPEKPDLPSTSSGGDEPIGVPVAVTLPTFDHRIDRGSFGPGFADGEYAPLAKVEPRYPIRLQREGIQGYAVVEYTVTTAGTTRDIREVEASHPLFERSCIEAAEKFRYRPRFIDGEAVEVSGVRNRCVYRLDE